MSDVKRKKNDKGAWGIYESKDGKPVFPVERDAHAMLRELVMKTARADGPELEKAFGVSEELSLFEKKRAALVLIGMKDLPDLCGYFDKKVGTSTVLLEEQAYILPGPDHDGVGFHAMTLGDILEYFDEDSGEWIKGAFCGIQYVNGKLPVQRESDDAQLQVEPHLIRRST